MLEIEKLESSLGLLNIFLDAAIGSIVLGLLLEYAPDFWARISRITPKWVTKLGEILVILGVAGELGLHIRSGQIEDKIKGIQRAEIIAQQRTIEQLLAKRKLSPDQKNRIAAAIAPFKPIKFVLVTVPEAEPWDFAMDIAATLKSHGWDWIPCPPEARLGTVKPMDDRPSACTSILDHIEINASPALEGLAKALAAAIKEPSKIGMDDVRTDISVNHPTMVIMVGNKR